MPSSFRLHLALLAAALLLSRPAFAFDTPLSDQAVREAYFLGQRHDGTFVRLLGKYTKFLEPPKTGPYISSIAFYTPFIQAVHFSDHYVGNYSAQQAALDHRKHGDEIVQIFVDIQFTDSYGRFLTPAADSRSHSPAALIPRPQDFWRDFQSRIYDGDRELTPTATHGHANYICGEGGCTLTGATLVYDFPAEAFASDAATIQVDPPEGDPVAVDFDHSHLR